MRRIHLDADRIRAEYEVASKLGLESSFSIDEKGNVNCTFGTRYYSNDAFLLHKFITFRLLYAEEAACVKHTYRRIDEDELLSYYSDNSDLFTRYNGDSFPFDEIKEVIRKKIREEEYEHYVDEILHKLD